MTPGFLLPEIEEPTPLPRDHAAMAMIPRTSISTKYVRLDGVGFRFCTAGPDSGVSATRTVQVHYRRWRRAFVLWPSLFVIAVDGQEASGLCARWTRRRVCGGKLADAAVGGGVGTIGCRW